jgi:hypothetical protein
MRIDNIKYRDRGRHSDVTTSQSPGRCHDGAVGSGQPEPARARRSAEDTITDNMRVKEVKISPDERFVICHNPEAAERDAHVRDQLLAQLRELITDSDALPAQKRGELAGRISTKPGLHRFLRTTPGGKLRIDAAKVKTEANLDGKYLLRCSDPTLSAVDMPWATNSSWRSNAAGGT